MVMITKLYTPEPDVRPFPCVLSPCSYVLRSQVMVEKLTPELLEHEFSLGPDAPQIAFRQLRQEWIDMGYGVPPESVKPRRGLAPDM